MKELAGRFGPPAGIVAHLLGASAVAPATGMPAERLVFVAPPRSLDRSTADWARIMGFTETVRRRMVEWVAANLGLPWDYFDLVERVREVDMPILVIHGRGDEEAEFDGGQAVAKAVPNGGLHAIEGLGHRRIPMNHHVAAAAAEFVSGRT